MCYPLDEGGLGIKRIDEWNKVATIKQIWHILTNKNSIWVAWVRAYLLKGKSLWVVLIPGKSSWTLRKVLQSRELVHGKLLQ